MGGELPELPLNVAQVSFMTRTECSPFLGLTGGALVAMTIPPFLVFFSSPTDTFFAFFVAFETLFVRYSFTALSPHYTIILQNTTKGHPGFCVDDLSSFLQLPVPRFSHGPITLLSQNLCIVAL